jgi:integral membrane protein (TIGR01906 family)
LKIILRICKWIFVLCLPILLLSSSIAWGFNSRWLYNSGFDKYKVSETTGFSQAELDNISEGFLDYFNSGEEYINVSLIRDGKPFDIFTREEQIHFKDVKDLVWLDYRFFAGSLLLVLAYAFFQAFRQRGSQRKELAKSLIWGCGLSMLLIILLAAGALFDFDQLFLQMHYLLFTNQYWSAQGYMLLLLPGGFWFDAAIICIAFMASLAILLGGLSIMYLKLKKQA